ncbi:MAG: hypothetical protein AAGA30_20810, partial [Planctomycetota bacterium]
IYRSRSGELENTTFVVLSPDGQEKLCRAHRSADRVFGNAKKMARELNQIANRYPSKSLAAKSAELPYVKSVDLALNVASAEQLPLAVIYDGGDQKELEKLEKLAKQVAWRKEKIGQFVYARSSESADLKPLAVNDTKPGIYLVHPGDFGLYGNSLQRVDSASSLEDLSRAMDVAIRKMPRVQKDHDSHVRTGIRLGIEWESAIPETDPQAVRARQHARGNR